MCDEVLRLPMPSGITLIGFADDLALVVVGKTCPILEQLVNPALEEVVR